MSTPAAKSPEQLYHQLQSAVRAVDQFSVKTVLEELDRRKLDLATLDKKLYPTKQVPLVFSALQDECRCRFVDLPKVGCSGLEIVRLLVERGLPCSHPDHPFVDLFAEVIIHNKIRMGDFGGQNEHDARENELCKCLKATKPTPALHQLLAHLRMRVPVRVQFLLNMDFRPAYPHLLESLIMLVGHCRVFVSSCFRCLVSFAALTLRAEMCIVRGIRCTTSSRTAFRVSSRPPRPSAFSSGAVSSFVSCPLACNGLKPLLTALRSRSAG